MKSVLMVAALMFLSAFLGSFFTHRSIEADCRTYQAFPGLGDSTFLCQEAR